MSLNKTEASIQISSIETLSATISPNYASNKYVTWSSSDESVATVDATGVITGVSEGTAIITATSADNGEITATCSVKVVVPGFVDLGLPSGTLWAECNVGANYPEDYGLYFAWGETTGYTSDTKDGSSFDWTNYKWCNGSASTMTKYCTSSKFGTVDNKTELEAADDAATVNWGSDWQMPSSDQLEELYNSSYTTTTWTTVNGVYGRKITSKSNGNSIFLPAAGYRDGSYLSRAGSYGSYWSRSLYASNSNHAYILYFYSSVIGWSYSNRFFGRSIRPVHVPIHVSSLCLNKTEASIIIGNRETLSATISPDIASNKNVTWSSSDESVATVDAAGVVTGVSLGTAIITATSADNSEITATCSVTVVLPGFVDLGLPSGTLWAECNIGANSPEDYGLYFAWGETQGYTGDTSDGRSFEWANYKWCKGTDQTMTKYCTSRSYGTVDN